MKTDVMYEIELKSLLDHSQYQILYKQLPNRFPEINRESIWTTRYYAQNFTPGDMRLRKSDKTLELVCKEGDSTKICRREVRITLDNSEILKNMNMSFNMIKLQQHPPWLKHKVEFSHFYKGFEYVICLQNIEKFAYILEVEHMSKTDTSSIHTPNLRHIIKSLNCEPIEPQDFKKKIKEYIMKNR